MVSMFNVSTGQVVAVAPMRNKQTSEVFVVSVLVTQLQLTGVCISWLSFPLSSAIVFLYYTMLLSS